jgi:hypothetical protein
VWSEVRFLTGGSGGVANLEVKAEVEGHYWDLKSSHALLVVVERRQPTSFEQHGQESQIDQYRV